MPENPRGVALWNAETGGGENRQEVNSVDAEHPDTATVMAKPRRLSMMARMIQLRWLRSRSSERRLESWNVVLHWRRTEQVGRCVFAQLYLHEPRQGEFDLALRPRRSTAGITESLAHERDRWAARGGPRPKRC